MFFRVKLRRRLSICDLKYKYAESDQLSWADDSRLRRWRPRPQNASSDAPERTRAAVCGEADGARQSAVILDPMELEDVLCELDIDCGIFGDGRPH